MKKARQEREETFFLNHSKLSLEPGRRIIAGGVGMWVTKSL